MRQRVKNMASSSTHSGPTQLLPNLFSGTWGLCPGWESWLQLSLLKVQLVAKLSTHPKDTDKHTETEH